MGDVPDARLIVKPHPAETPEVYAVSMYNAETRALLCHTIRPLGERKVQGYERRAFAFEIRDGFIDPPSLLYTDGTGNLLRLEAESQRLTVTSLDGPESKRILTVPEGAGNGRPPAHRRSRRRPRSPTSAPAAPR